MRLLIDCDIAAPVIVRFISKPYTITTKTLGCTYVNILYAL